ncbi:adhesion G protein-coupled receptor E2-like [Physella acuta]|uniref:adhesion G protein-coupled receptor E2-like n=1 Tax=Physella acuta TaxID=109671 RepID=UPI0027DC1CA9|nr:adhesion G protein-coupled receptor E2-like [Physella acuta]
MLYNLYARHNKELATKNLVSDIIAFSIHGFHGELRIPLRVSFFVDSTNYTNPVCAFLDFSADESGVWSSDGCHVVYYDQDYVTCECNHTTNFAVLMSPYIDQHKDNYIINTISIICLSVSIICLLATVLVYAVLWRYVKSDRAVLYVNLSVTLTLGYVVFLSGINQTQNKVMCTAIAAALHFLFLVVFFSMLGQGLNVLVSVISMTTRSVLRYLLPLSYCGPLLIVVITLAVTKAHGYIAGFPLSLVSFGLFQSQR